MMPSMTEMCFSQLMFWSISLMCLYAGYLFFNSVDGKLRILVIWLFLSLAWAFGIDGIYWLVWDIGGTDGMQPITLRLIKNAPLVVAVLRLILYMKAPAS